MRCTQCSHDVLPIVCVDVDGTISDYHDALGRFIGEYWDVSIPYEPWDGTGEFSEYLGISKPQYRDAKLAYRQGGFKRWSPPQPELGDLRQCVAELRFRQLAEVWITTTRPWMRLDSVDPDTRFWLDRHFPVYDHILYDEHKYKKLSTVVDSSRVVAVIDDLPSQVTVAAMEFPRAIVRMIDMPHNRTAPVAVPRSASLNEFAVEMRERVEQWWQ